MLKLVAKQLNKRGYKPNTEEYDPWQDPVVKNCLILMAITGGVMLYAIGQAWRLW
jgi:hypothetical protein